MVDIWNYLYTHLDPIYALSVLAFLGTIGLGALGWYFGFLRAFAGALTGAMWLALWAFGKGEAAQLARDKIKAPAGAAPPDPPGWKRRLPWD